MNAVAKPAGGQVVAVQLPESINALVALAQQEDSLNELTGGVTAGFPVLSIKGKVWRMRAKGEEEMLLDAQGNALPSINIVMVKANPLPSKIYYDKGFVEGSTEAPRCFSNDGLKPSDQVNDPVSPVCATCPKNQWGSKITEQGKKARACADARRMAVAFIDDLNQLGKDAPLYLLRVPAASLNPLKDYAEKVLKPKGIPQFAISTTVGFDPQVAHPQLTFRPHRFVNAAEAEAIIALRESEEARRILAEAVDFEPAAGGAAGAGDEAPHGAAGTAPVSAATSAPASTPPAAARKPAAKRARPATEEEAGLDIAPAPAPAPAAPAPAAAAPAAAKPRAARKSAAPAAAAAPAPAPAPVEATEEGGEEAIDDAAPSGAAPADPALEDMLSAILG